MREFVRPSVNCPSCHANIYWHPDRPDRGADDLLVGGWGIPGARAVCPRCHGDIDTTNAFSSILGFPPTFTSLISTYANFSVEYELQRRHFENEINEFVGDDASDTDIEHILNEAEGKEWYRQRLFYRSCMAFYRSYQLFLGFLTLERHCYVSWATVTGYYSRFFFIQAYLNLCLASWDSTKRRFYYFDGDRIRCTAQRSLCPTIKNAGSHEIWWQLMEAMKQPVDYPYEEDCSYVLSRMVFDPSRRNLVNYSFEYLKGGFIELEFCDSALISMMGQLNPVPRGDRDISDVDRYFRGCDPGNCDVGNYYGDDAQSPWRSLLFYLRSLKQLDIAQTFVRTDKLAWLTQIHIGTEYPSLMRGLLMSISDILQDAFDVDKFVDEDRKHLPWEGAN